ncbi:MAG: hypothetical protein KBS44_05675, partial [Clostridiales bacterium]|nr:hypothetical protein [Candidatus Coliplasma equi]
TIKSAGTQDYADFAVVVLEYNHKKFSYVKKDFYDVGKANGDIKIPADGYVLAIHKSFDEKIKAIKNFNGDTTFFPHGFVPNAGLNTKIKAASKAPVIDGAVSSGEYGTAIWKIEPKNTLVSYAQFEDENYYASAEVYLTYDKDFLYLGVIVDSPYHDNTCTSSNAGSMYNFESIQVNVCSEPTTGDYISEHWDNVVDPVAANTNVVRQYGFCVNNNDETLYTVWMGTEKIFNGTTVCKRDDTTKKTVYEAAIPWSECGSKDHPINVKSGTKFGFSVSINCGSEAAQFKNIVLRDGGGIIGLNDWTKVPTITLG